MANTFDKSSFIPQKSLRSTNRRRTSLGLLPLIGVILFIISLLGLAGAFAYKKVLENNVGAKFESFERAKGAFDPTLVEDLARLNDRIEGVEEVLSSHVAVSPLLELIEELTLKNVSFNRFDFNIRDSGAVSILMSGQAKDYATVVLQSDLLGQNRFLKDQIFSDINLDNSGNVRFSWSANVDHSLVSFINLIEGF